MMKNGFKGLVSIALICMIALFIGCFMACTKNKQPEKVTLNFIESEITMSEWSSIDVTATASDASAVTLSVSDPNVLYLNGTVITALKPGTATVTATLKSDESIKEMSTVTVTADANSRPSVSISGEEVIGVGDTAIYKATLLHASAGEYKVDYKVSNDTIAEIDSKGVLKSKNVAGTVEITATATYRTVKFDETFRVTVSPITVAFKEENVSMDEWDSKKIEATAFISAVKDGSQVTLPHGAPITLAVSDPNVLYISGNTVTAIGSGSATITATLDRDETVKATATVKVNANPSAKPEFNMTGDTLIATGDTQIYEASLSNSSAGAYNVVYTILNSAETGEVPSNIAEISSVGVLTAKKAETITVVATTTYCSVRFESKVKVNIVNVAEVTFLKKDKDSKLFNIKNVFKVSGVGEGTSVTIGEESYVADANGNVELLRETYATENGKIKELTVGGDTKKYYVRTYVSTAEGLAYSNEDALQKDNGVYKVNKDTVYTDANGLTWITFDDCKAQLNNKYKYLRIKVKFLAFADEDPDLNAGVVVHKNQSANDIPYGYSFGYKYGANTFVYFDRTYQGYTNMFGGTVNQGTGWAFDTNKPVLNIYDAAGNRLMQWENSQWSPYIEPLEADTEYIFEFPVESAGDIAVNFGLSAEVSEIEWGIWDLYSEEAAGATDTSDGEIYDGEDKLTEGADGYKLDGTTVTPDGNDMLWVNFGNDDSKLRAYKYLRVTVKISEFAGKGEGEGGIPSYNTGYGFDFGFKYRDKFVCYDATNGYGFHGNLISGDGAGAIPFVIYDVSGNVIGDWTNANNIYYPWSNAFTLNLGTEYIFEFPVSVTGEIIANFGANATVTDITWSKTSFAELIEDAKENAPETSVGELYDDQDKLLKDENGYKLDNTTVTPDEYGMLWVNFGKDPFKYQSYDYLRVTVKISEFAGKGEGEGGIPSYNTGYGFDFGFKYRDKFVCYDGTNDYGFHGNLISGYGAGAIPFVIYGVSGNVIGDWTNANNIDYPWSNAFALNLDTEYIFEFPVSVTGIITANFGANATVTNITWAKTPLGATA